MTESGPRFCPRCGAGAVAGMPFCPQCGFDLAGVARATARATAPEPALSAASPRVSPTAPPAPVTKPDDPSPPAASRIPVAASPPRASEIRSRFPPVVLAGLLVMIGLIAYGLLSRPPGAAPPAGGPAGSGSGSAGPATALISGLTILSPTDGQSVATKEVNVIGTAPPGVSITQDISFGLDQHATSDGTGHWAMTVSLNNGENKLVFRIGDDASTKKEIRVVYTPPSGG